MKKVTCKQIGGACDKEFYANTFEELAEMSKVHAIEMFQKGDQAHIDAMEKMKHLMFDPEAMQKWMEEKKKEFEALPDIKE